MKTGAGSACRLRPILGWEKAEAEMALEQLKDLQGRGFAAKTVGVDKGYHAAVRGCREQKIKPHVAQQKGRTVESLKDAPADPKAMRPAR